MSRIAHSPAVAGARRIGVTGAALLGAEFMKIRTIRTWRWFGLTVIFVTVWTALRNGVGHHYGLHPPPDQLGAAQQAQAVAAAAHAHTEAGKAAIAADMTTSGQFLGVLFAFLLGVLAIGNEFFHQTAIATFMANPRRGRVIVAKLTAAAGFGGLFWFASTLINLIVTPIYLRAEDISIPLTDPPVVRSMLFSLVAYLLWPTLGLGLGTAIRSQTGAVITAAGAYLAGTAAVTVVVNLLYNVYPHDWVLAASVIAPAVASLVMVSPGPAFEHAPPPWVGLLVLVGYAILLTIAAMISIRRRDVL
jgi:ABC-2 type transport system permease protein